MKIDMDNKTMTRYLALLLLMIVGVGEMWGQTDKDYSGTYCIANDNLKNNIYDYSNGNGHPDNYYMCSAIEYYDNGSVSSVDNGKPFLTTYKTKQGSNSIWVVEKVTDTNYYTFKLHGTSKYLTVNNSITDYKPHRRRVHLEELTELSDRNYFTIERLDLPKYGVYAYTIGCVDAYKNGNNQYLNPAGGNFNIYNSTDNKETPRSGGIVGFFTKGSSKNSVDKYK